VSIVLLFPFLLMVFSNAVGQSHDVFGRFDLNLDEAQQRGPLSELL